MPHFGVPRIFGLFGLLTLFLNIPLAYAQEKPTEKSVPAKQETTPANKSAAVPAEYAGSETCKTCHEAIYNGWEKGPHWKQTLNEGGIAKHGCEDCHGAAAAHVADPSDTSMLLHFGKASSKDINARCETCHASGTQHLKAINSLHRQADVSCVSCHSSHHAEGREFLLSRPQPQLCVTCHQAQKAQFEMPFHHRVNEGLSTARIATTLTAPSSRIRCAHPRSRTPSALSATRISKALTFSSTIPSRRRAASPATSRTVDQTLTCSV
jgi:predicted CXXCH cytochrome family protein